MNTVACPACGHQNEPSRVFCHNCGVRLPRSAEADETMREENREANHKAATLRRAPKTPEKGRRWQDFAAAAIASLMHLALSAALFAAIVLCFREPEGMPPPASPDPKLVAAGDLQLESAVEEGVSKTIEATQEQINAYLAGKLEVTGRALGIQGGSKVLGTFVILGDGEFRLGMVHRLAGLPLVAQSAFRLVPGGGGKAKQGLELVSGSIGRLPVPALVFRKVLRWYRPVAEALAQPLGALEQADRIEIQPRKVIASWNTQKPASSGRFSSPFQSPSLQGTSLPKNP